jgi:hypothetical protein
MDTEDNLLLRVQKPVTGPYPEPIETSPHLHTRVLLDSF